MNLQKRWRLSIGSIVVILAVGGCSTPPSTVSMQDRHALAEIRHRLQEAENAGDAAGVRVLFADDIIMMAPGRDPLYGLEAAVESMQDAFDLFSLQVEYRSDELVVVGDWAFDRGKGTGTFTPKAGGAPIVDNSKYLWIYRRAQGGAWKLTHVMWNDNGTVPQPS